jgi:hypothetical protein
VNPIAGDLVKPCLACASFLAIVNLKLLFLWKVNRTLVFVYIRSLILKNFCQKVFLCVGRGGW